MVKHGRIRRLTLLFIMGVIDDQKIRTLTGDSTPDTDGEIVTPLGGTPPTCRLGVRPKGCIREYSPVILRIHQVTDLTPETYRQFRSMRRLNHLLLGELAQEPRGKQKRPELRLGMPGWHTNDQPLEFARSDFLKLLTHDLVMPTRNETGPHPIHKGNETLLRQFLRLGLLILLKKPIKLSLLILR
jgi:hypothetical protein